ncbi:MAG: N-acetyl sugar amidotransferase, partial [Bacteroidetes bacterium]|nr:N-acetyl sugar amidotransferase [Bacteroidota bacterium]
MSNQRPASIPEFKHNKNRDGAKYMQIDSESICDACHQAEKKELINWDDREKELVNLLDKYRRNDGKYDCLVPGSGGKDSVY